MRPFLAFVATACGMALAASAQAPNASVSKASLPNAPQPRAAISTKQHPILSASSVGPDISLEFSNSTQVDPDAGDVSLYTIVDLALRNSKTVQIAEAEQQHALGAWNETRHAYIPSFAVGSGLGYSYGFPIGGPYLFSVASNSLLLSFSQHDYIHSTRAAWKAATLAVKNARQQVILDASLKYIELNTAMGQIAALNQAMADADTMVGVVEDRMHAGLESKINLTQAQLTRAKIHLREIQMEDHADELRKHLAELTGLEAASIVPSASSIPPLPDLDFPSLMRDGDQSPKVQAAFATAESRRFSALGDKNQNYRPTVGMVFLYQLFSTFNGYQQYYLSFQQNNIAAGIQALWPLFDPVRRDKAVESKAEAVRAQRQAEQTRIQNNENNFALWHSLRELEAQEQVADLQQQLAQDTLSSIETQMEHGSASAAGAPITPQQTQEYRIEERTGYVDLQDAQFSVTRVKLDLLNAVGGLEDWAKTGSQSSPGSHALIPQVIQH